MHMVATAKTPTVAATSTVTVLVLVVMSGGGRGKTDEARCSTLKPHNLICVSHAAPDQSVGGGGSGCVEF